MARTKNQLSESRPTGAAKLAAIKAKKGFKTKKKIITVSSSTTSTDDKQPKKRRRYRLTARRLVAQIKVAQEDGKRLLRPSSLRKITKAVADQAGFISLFSIGEEAIKLLGSLADQPLRHIVTAANAHSCIDGKPHQLKIQQILLQFQAYSNAVDNGTSMIDFHNLLVTYGSPSVKHFVNQVFSQHGTEEVLDKEGNKVCVPVEVPFVVLTESEKKQVRKEAKKRKQKLEEQKERALELKEEKKQKKAEKRLAKKEATEKEEKKAKKSKKAKKAKKKQAEEEEEEAEETEQSEEEQEEEDSQEE